MQKGDAAKLKLLLSGISARLTKNRDFFVQAVCTFTSGKKKFDAQLARTEQGYALRFQGSTREVDAAGFSAFFAEQAEKFDESVLTYTERSAVVTLSVTARGVQMKQAEREATAEEKAAAANPPAGQRAAVPDPCRSGSGAAAGDRHPDRRRQAQKRHDPQIQPDRPLCRAGRAHV